MPPLDQGGDPQAHAIPAAHAEIPPVGRWPQLAQQAINAKPKKALTTDEKKQRYFRNKTMTTVRRMHKGLRIDRKHNSCPTCKLPDIEKADQAYLWGVDEMTIAEKFHLNHDAYHRHVWYHHLDRKRFQHPANLYRGFIDQMNFKEASPDAKLALALRAIDRMVDLAKAGSLPDPVNDAHAMSEMTKLLSTLPSQDEPEYSEEDDEGLEPDDEALAATSKEEEEDEEEPAP